MDFQFQLMPQESSPVLAIFSFVQLPDEVKQISLHLQILNFLGFVWGVREWCRMLFEWGRLESIKKFTMLYTMKGKILL